MSPRPIPTLVRMARSPAEWPAAARAAAWMVLACFAFAALWGFIRLGSQSGLHPFALVFFRNLFGLLFIVHMIVGMGPSLWQTRRIGTHIRRATSGVIATFATFYAVANAPLADAMAITYGAPLFATIGAVLFLGERIRARRVIALVAGFAGVLVVLRPGHVPLTPGIAAALVAAVATAFSVIAVKQLSGTEDPRAVVVYSFVLMLPPSLLIAMPYLTMPSLTQCLYLLAIGGLATLGQVGTVRAMRLADASAVMPYDFVRFALVVAISVFAFGEPFDVFTALGGGIILLATIYMAHRESRAARRQPGGIAGPPMP